MLFTSNNFTLAIAEIEFNIQSRSSNLLLESSNQLKYFISQNVCKNAFNITFQLAHQSPLDNWSVIFDGNQFSHGVQNYQWLIKRSPDHIGIEVILTGDEKLRMAVAILNLQNHQIEVFIIPHQSDIPIAIDPFFYPLGPLLLYYVVHHKGGFMIHASGVADIDKGYIFTGVSGIGKSTMARLWRENCALTINDDRLVLRPQVDGLFKMYNTPMPYYADLYKSAPVNAIFLLKQNPTNYLTPVKGSIAFSKIISNCIQQFYDKEMVEKHLDVVAQFCAQTPIFEVGFKPDHDVVELIRSHFNL